MVVATSLSWNARLLFDSSMSFIGKKKRLKVASLSQLAPVCSLLRKHSHSLEGQTFATSISIILCPFLSDFDIRDQPQSTMYSQNAVGFGFQADIVDTANLAHMLTGRVLKAMSDGGVDFYAVAAAIYLGRYVPVRKSLESTVRTHLASRGSSRSVLNKILSIGWGHSEVAIEMSRTQAGTNALLLIGALAAGHYPIFSVAQCLSELLSLSGCEADKVPNVDVLKGLVEYLAPFTFDLGFSKVLDHITIVAERAIRSSGDVNGSHHSMPPQLSELGDASMLAGAIKQLILTARRGERMYMIIKKHGSWLPAFASHILGMEVELRYTREQSCSGSLLTDETNCGNMSTQHASGSEQPKESAAQNRKGKDVDPIIWACAGDQGSVVFDLGSSDHTLNSLFRSVGSGIEIIDCHDRVATLKSECFLQDALANQLSRRPEIGGDLSEGIQKAIARRSWSLLKNIRMSAEQYTPDDSEKHHRINGPFSSIITLKETLTCMGISEQSQGVMGLPFSKESTREPQSPYHTLMYLDHKDHQDLIMSCTGPHEKGLSGCLCDFVVFLIEEFAASAVALMQCKFDASKLLVVRPTHVRPWTSGWSRILACMEDLSPGYIEYSSLMNHLCVLLFGHNLPAHDPEKYYDAGVAGFSFRAHTVFYTALMQHDSFDDFGRTITITSGRAYVDGCLRHIILEDKHTDSREIEVAAQTICPNPLSAGAFALAAGSFVKPHYQPSDMKVYLYATASEDMILVRFSVGRLVSESIKISLLHSIEAFLTFWRMPTCQHDKQTPFKVTDGMELKLVGFHLRHELGLSEAGDLTLIALHGNKLHQLLTCGLYSTPSWVVPSTVTEPNYTTILQLEACLRCCIMTAQEAKRSSCIIMGG